MHGSIEYRDSIAILNYILLFLIVVYALVQMILKIGQPLQLVFILIVFLFLLF